MCSLVDVSITASCSSDLETSNISGIYRVTGVVNGRIMYEKTSQDPNGNWWVFSFDSSNNSWNFTYYRGHFFIGGFLFGTPIEPLTNEPG